MANPVILSASGDVLVIKGSARGGVGPTILTFTGSSWTGSAVVKINTAYPGEAVSLVTVAYTNRATGATVAAGTAITADAVIEVGQNNADIYLTYTHTSGTCNVVTLEAPMNSRVPNPLDVDVSIFDTSLTSASGTIRLGASPPATGALRVDASTYSTVVFRTVNGTSDARFVQSANGNVTLEVQSANSLVFGANNETKWTVNGAAAGTALLTAGQAIAQIVGGATSTTFYQSNGSTVAYQYLAAGQAAFGGAAVANSAFRIGTPATASSATGLGLYVFPTITAAANNDVLYNTRIEPTWTPGAFTGLQAIGLEVRAFTVASFSTPANPIGINVGVITGTGASVATALQLAPPTGASTNYLIAHTTAATFNVTAAGAINCAGNVTSADSIIAGAAVYLGWTGRSLLASPSNGVITIGNATLTDFSRLQFGGTTTSFPALIRAGASLAVGLGDGSYTGAYFGVGIAASSTTALIVPAGTTGISSLRVPHGAAPTSPVDGDMWTTTAGLFVRINGATVGPLS